MTSQDDVIKLLPVLNCHIVYTNVPIKGLTNFYNDDDDGDVVVDDDDDDDEGDDDDVYFIQHPLRRHRQLHDDGVRLRRSCPCSNA